MYRRPMPMHTLDALPALATTRYQRLSTTVYDPDTGLEATFVVYPSTWREGSSGEQVPIPRWSDLDPRDLGFEDMGAEALSSTPNLSHTDAWERTLAGMLRPDLFELVTDTPAGPRWSKHLADLNVPPDLRAFTRYLLERPLIPFRRSPITGQSLSGLVGRSSGAGTGALIGAYAGMDHGLLLLVTTPGGMIIGGTAMGIASALEKGLHQKILAMIVPPGDN